MIQIRSLDGTVYEQSLAEEIDPEEKRTRKDASDESNDRRCGGVTQGTEGSHSLLDSNPVCDFKNSWNCGVLWASFGTHTEAMRYSSCDSAVDLWADVVRDEHICGPGAVETTQYAHLSNWKRGN